MRLYMQSGRIQYDRKVLPGSSFEDFDLRRLVNYFRDIRQQEHPAEDDPESWITLLVNTELMVWDRGYAMGTVGGMLLFGKNPNRYLKQAGITATAYSGHRERLRREGPSHAAWPRSFAVYTAER